MRYCRWLMGVTAMVAIGLSPLPLWAQQAQPPALQPGRTLSLEDAVRIGLQQNPAIRAALEGRHASEARVPQAQSFFYPRVDANGSYQRVRTLSSVYTRFSEDNSYAGTLSATQKIWDFGKTSSLVDSARADLQVNTEEVERVRNLVALNVKTAYFLQVESYRLVQVAQATLDRANLNLRSAQGRFEVGTVPKSDVTRAEVDVANARVGLIRARNGVRIAETTLKNAMGVETDFPLQVMREWSPDTYQVDQAQLLKEAFVIRPELKQARGRVEGFDALLLNAKRQYFPDFNGNGSGTRSDIDFPPERNTWQLGLTLSWNLFDGFFKGSKIKEATANLQAARANLNTLELQVRLEVDQAYLNLVEATERIEAAAKSVESAQENLRLAQGRYDAGVGTILDLTDAQVALTNAEVQHVQAVGDQKITKARLDNAVGRR